ncbi:MULTISPECIES: DUF4429 domain-containing protein [Streptomyces]|uniref:DUF4429 domain-containing protein n=1 Tax=Streptomyces ehimensis TaxID=68195 RepID=A0ABV9BER6_9ACTN
MLEVSSTGGDVQFDGRVIRIRRVSRMARSVFRQAQQQTIPITAVQGIEWRDASRWHAGHIRLVVAGSQASTQPTAVNRDENAVLFGLREQPEFEELRTAIEQALSQ